MNKKNCADHAFVDGIWPCNRQAGEVFRSYSQGDLTMKTITTKDAIKDDHDALHR